MSPLQKESSRGRHRDKEDIKIVKERTPESEEEHVEWETNRDGEFESLCLAFRILIVYWPVVSFEVPFNCDPHIASELSC